MNLIEVHFGGEVGVGGACEEIQAAVAAEDGAGLLHDRRYRRIAQHIVIAGTAGHGAQFRNGIRQNACVDKVQVNAFLLLHLTGREQLFGAGKTVGVDVSDDHHTGFPVAVQGIGQRTESHRTGTGHDCQLPAFTDAHFMLVNTHLGVVSGMESTDGAAHRLCKRSFIVCLAFIDQQAAALHYLCGKDAVGGIAAAELIGVAGAPHGALVVQGRLLGELHAGFVDAFVLLTDLDNVAGKFMPGDGGMLRDIVMYALMSSSENGALVGGHADGIRDHPHQDLVILDFGELKFLQTEVVGGMQTHSFCFHFKSLLHYTLDIGLQQQVFYIRMC